MDRVKAVTRPATAESIVDIVEQPLRLNVTRIEVGEHDALIVHIPRGRIRHSEEAVQFCQRIGLATGIDTDRILVVDDDVKFSVVDVETM